MAVKLKPTLQIALLDKFLREHHRVRVIQSPERSPVLSGFLVWLIGALTNISGRKHITICLVIKYRMHIQYYVQGPRQERLRSSLAEFGRSVDGEVIRQLSSTHYSRGAVYICIGEFIDFNPHDPKDYPSVGGIYVLYDIRDRPLYIGQGMTIDKRLRNHYDKFWFKPPIIESASYLQIDDKPLRERIEAVLTKFLKSNAVINKRLVNR